MAVTIDDVPPLAGGRPPTRFARMARWLAEAAGSGAAAVVLASSFVVWVAVGARTGYPRWWELAVTVGLPFVTLGLLIVIQHTQTHGNHALHLKLDEIIEVHQDASDEMVGLEEASPQDLAVMRARRDRDQAPKSNSRVADRSP